MLGNITFAHFSLIQIIMKQFSHCARIFTPSPKIQTEPQPKPTVYKNKRNLVCIHIQTRTRQLSCVLSFRQIISITEHNLT